MKLRVLRRMKYATRQLEPGDVFEAKTPRDSRLLLAIKKAELVEPAARAPKPRPAPVAVAEMPVEFESMVQPKAEEAQPATVGAMTFSATMEGRAALRAEYQTLTGEPAKLMKSSSMPPST